MTSGVGVGGVYKSLRTMGVGVSSVYKNVIAGHTGVGGVWKQFFAAFNTGAQDVDGIGTAELTYNTDGTYTVSLFGTQTLWRPGAPITGTGTGVWIRLVKTSGNDIVGQNTWYEITTNRYFYISVVGVSDQSWSGYCEFSVDGGSTVVANANTTLYAQYVGL